MTFTLLGIEFNGLAMLSRFLDGFIAGFGFMIGAFMILLFFVLLTKDRHKKQRFKPRVKLIQQRKCYHCGVNENKARGGVLALRCKKGTLICMDCDFKL